MCSVADLTIPTGYALLTFSQQHTGIAHTALVTLGIEIAAPPFTAADAADCLNAWQTAVKPLWDAEVVISRCVALVGNDGPPFRYDVTSSVTGTRSSVVIAPPNVTYLVRKTTAFAGRQYRGRMYLPYVNSVGITQTGALQSSELTVLTTAMNAITSNLIGATPNVSNLVLLHSDPLSGGPPPPTVIASLSAQATVATQRRRLERP